MIRSAKRRGFTLSAVIAVILLGFWLRLLFLGASPLRGDEAFTIQYWAAPWPNILELSRVEPHPYGAFLLFGLWKSLFGDGEWVMRLLPALLSLPGIAATGVLGAQLLRRERLGLLAALLYAIHPFLIWHAQDVRNYAIWAALAPITMVAFWFALKYNRRRDWSIYVLAAACSAYIFLFDIFFLAAQAIYVLVFRRQLWRPWALSMLALGALLMPWGAQVLTLITQSGYGGTAGEFVFGQLFSWFLPTLAVGSTLPADITSWVWPALVVFYIAACVALWRWRREAAILLLLMILAPVLLMALVATRMDIFRPRYLLALVSYLIVAAVGLIGYLTTRRNIIFRASGLSICAGFFLLSGIALVNYYTNPAFAKAPDWRSFAAFMTANAGANDLIVIQAVDPAFTYYYQGPADDIGMSPYNNTPEQIDRDVLAEALNTYRAIWIVPDSAPYAPLTWLIREAQSITTYSSGGIQAIELRPWTVPDDEYRRRTPIIFGQVGSFLDWQIDRLDAHVLRIILYWEPLRIPDAPLHGFVHLVGPPQPDTGWTIWTQDDHPVTATHWEAGRIRRDVYTIILPGDILPGDWRLDIGLYDPVTLARVPVAGSDHLEVPLARELIESAGPRG